MIGIYLNELSNISLIYLIFSNVIEIVINSKTIQQLC